MIVHSLTRGGGLSIQVKPADRSLRPARPPTVRITSGIDVSITLEVPEAQKLYGQLGAIIESATQLQEAYEKDVEGDSDFVIVDAT